MVTSGFFDSVNGDRKYNADQISDYFLKLISNGVFATPADAMQVQAAGGLNVNVTAGWGFINCKWINNDNLYNLQLTAADILLNRIDRVVLRLDKSSTARAITIQVKTGSVGATPTPPALTRSGDIYELSLAQIYVAANATEITQAEITDERPDTTVCGFVTGLIDQIDTTNLFAQYNSAFNRWFDTVKATLSEVTLIAQFGATYTTLSENETEIPIGVENYNFALDVLNVYINGLKLVRNVDFTEDTENGTITLAQPLEVIGTPVEFEVLKSLDTSEAESVLNLVLQIQAQQQNFSTRLNGLAFLKCTQQQYDDMSSHDANTVYIIVSEAL